MSALDLPTQAAFAGDFPTRVNKREAKLLESVEAYVAAQTGGFKIVATGLHTSVADASDPFANTISVAGVVASDIVMVSVKSGPAAPVSLLAAAAGTDSIAVRFSADPSTDHVLQYIVVRAN